MEAPQQPFTHQRPFTVKEVAELLNVHPNTVRLWSNRGLLPCYRIGPRGDRRFSTEGVRRFLASRQGQDTL